MLSWANFLGYLLDGFGGVIWMSESLYLQNKLKTTTLDVYFNQDMKSVFLHGKEINIWQLTELTSPVQLFIYYLLYGKPSLRQIPVLWLVLSRSGFCSTDRFHGNGPIRVFLFWSEAGKFKICNHNSEKKVWIMSFFTLKLSEETKRIEIFPKFQR